MQDLSIFHRNLRIEDNAALYNASLNQDYSSVFIFDKEYWSQSDRSVNQLKFVIDSLNELELELKKFNVNLYIFEGNLGDFASYMNQNHPNSNLHMNHTTETEYFSRNLKALKQNFSLNVNEYKDFGIQIKNQNRDCWASDWQNYMKSETYKIPLVSKKFKTMNLPKFSEFKNYVNNYSAHIQKGGTLSGKGLLTSFLEKRCKGYSKKMSNPSDAVIACSRLSPHIAFGTLSIRNIYQELEKNINNSKYRWDLYSFKKRLHWHCHFIQKLDTQPSLQHQSMHPDCDNLRTETDNELIEKWITGNTGFPFVDACMLYLQKYGWINFRMRAMLMSFASYNLWQPWQKTSPLLASTFTDYEPGIHICQVQMQSGVTGINLPRIYSVTKQSLDQDPDASWIKEQIPDLRNIEKEKIHNAELGELYKEKIVDIKSSAKKARELVWQIRSNANFKSKAKVVYQLHGSRKRLST
jgi:deoxyribodipyrimidine photo-lyase